MDKGLLLALGVSTGAAFAAAAAGQPIPIGGPVTVNATIAGDQRQPRVAADGADNFQIVWQTDEGEPSTSNVRRRRLSSAGALGTDSLLSEAADGDQSAPVIGMNTSGDWTAAWISDHETVGDIEVFSRRTSTDGTILEAEQQLDADGDVGEHSGALSIARAVDDSYAALYRLSETGDAMNTSTYGSGGNPLFHEELGPTVSLGYTGIAGIGPGAFVVAWMDADANLGGVSFNCTYSGHPNWLALSPYDDPAGDQTFPGVGSDGDGRIVIVWQQGSDIFGRILMYEGQDSACDFHSDEFPVNSDPVANAVFPRVAMAADGAFVVAWNSNVEADGAVSVREFTKSGAPVGDQFGAHSATDGNQAAPDVAISATTFAVVWQTPDAGAVPPQNIAVRRFVRRVVFTDDFELFGTDAWSDIAP